VFGNLPGVGYFGSALPNRAAILPKMEADSALAKVRLEAVVQPTNITEISYKYYLKRFDSGSIFQ
jgi:hypothetical protein